MPLTNKYLKYSPEITLKIFTLVWNKLIEKYLPSYPDDINARFKEFKFGECIKLSSNDVGIYSIDPSLSETTVQEILGYDPFVKDDFVLPEKWCIKIPKFKDAPKEIIDWRVNVKKCGSWNTSGYLDNSGWHSDNITDGYTEISFDQFKKHVLKLDVKESKEVIPEYVELLEGFDNTCTGKIFDTNQPIPQMSGWSNQWTWESIFKNDIQRPYFKPSTKEAFVKMIENELKTLLNLQ